MRTHLLLSILLLAACDKKPAKVTPPTTQPVDSAGAPGSADPGSATGSGDGSADAAGSGSGSAAAVDPSSAVKPTIDEVSKAMSSSALIAKSLRRCAGMRKLNTPEEAKLGLVFTIKEDGHLTDVTVTGGTPDIAKCVTDLATTSWTLPKPVTADNKATTMKISLSIVVPAKAADPITSAPGASDAGGSTSVPKPAAPSSKPTADDLAKAISAKAIQKDLKDCQTEAKKKDPKAAGKVQLSFTIKEDGHLTDSKASGINADIEACIVGKMSAWTMPKPMTADNKPTTGSFGLTVVLQ